MSSDLHAKKIIAVFRKLSEGISDAESAKSRFEDSEKLNSLLKGGVVVCSVFNHIKVQYEYASPNIKQMLGISAKHFLSLPYQVFLKRYMHPDDLKVLSTQLIPDLVKHATHKKEDISTLSVNYNYRLKNAFGEWIKVNQQSSPIKLDNKGNIILDINFYTLAGNASFKDTNLINLSIFVKNAKGINTLEKSINYMAKNDKRKYFTERELEILKMLAKGKTSKEIAKVLFISESTVVTHRKNMLEKFDLKNTNELVAHAFKSGIIRS